MNRLATCGLLVLIIVTMNSLALAHPGHSHRNSSRVAAGRQPVSSERIWTASTGAFRERGPFVMSRDGMVQIRREDDSLVLLPILVLSNEDRDWIERRMSEIRRIAQENRLLRVSTEFAGLWDSPSLLQPPGDRGVEIQQNAMLFAQIRNKKQGKNVSRDQVPEIAQAFEVFVKRKAIQTRWDDKYFYVESNGIPDHAMMVGITAWQQQVPLPQKYVGDNAWQIPLHPVPAEKPATTRNRFLRGAIAVAVNGIPIFNPLNNRGDDAYLFGELDEFGGHCGRADDYHYHLAPVHLEKTNGKGKPIAYALDGYPIYGYEEPDGSPAKNLDALNGHKDASGNYHYHATPKYPYLNGGFYGVVTEREGQVDPQPRAEPLRPALTPLRDAKITGFQEIRPGSYRLTYDVQGKQGTVSYTLTPDGSAKFTYVDTSGRMTEESYSPRKRDPGRGDRSPLSRPGEDPQPRGERRPSRNNDRPGPSRAERARESSNSLPWEAKLPQLNVTSSSADSKGFLSVDCTCDGASQSPAVAWNGVPPGTKSFAISLWHTAPDQEKSYWVVYNIPASTTSLLQNSKQVGTLGINDRRRTEYDPMCSKGPGMKTYHITVYALSAELDLKPEKASRAELLKSIKEVALAAGTLDVKYERAGSR